MPALARANRQMNPSPAQLAIRSGDRMAIRQDDGSTVYALARSDPWELFDGTWVISYVGRPGGFLLTRCTAAPL